MRFIHWTIATGEYSFAKSLRSEQIKDIAISNIRGRDILLMHDDNALIPHVLDSMIIELENRNFNLANAHLLL